MPLGGPNEGWASNAGYGLSQPTSGVTSRVGSNTGNPQIGAEAKYGIGGWARPASLGGAGAPNPGKQGASPGGATAVSPEWLEAQRILRNKPAVTPTTAPAPAPAPAPAEQPTPDYWGSGPGPVWGGPPVPGGFGGFGVHPSSWGSSTSTTGSTQGKQPGGGQYGGATGGGGGWAGGGVIRPGQSGFVGERGPEFARGLPGGGVAITPNHQLGDRRVMLANALQGRGGGGGGGITGLGGAARPMPVAPGMPPAGFSGGAPRPMPSPAPPPPPRPRMGGWQG